MAKVQASLRSSVDDLETRPDALVPYIASTPFANQLAGGEVSRADVLRIAINLGLTALEEQALALAEVPTEVPAEVLAEVPPEQNEAHQEAHQASTILGMPDLPGGFE